MRGCKIVMSNFYSVHFIPSWMANLQKKMGEEYWMMKVTYGFHRSIRQIFQNIPTYTETRKQSKNLFWIFVCWEIERILLKIAPHVFFRISKDCDFRIQSNGSVTKTEFEPLLVSKVNESAAWGESKKLFCLCSGK